MRATVSPFHPAQILARAAAAVVSLKTFWDRRRLVAHLAGLDDHMLRDIGLTRFDLDSALADPFLSDPTARLSIRAREARSNQRAAALEQRQFAALLGSQTETTPKDWDRRAA